MNKPCILIAGGTSGIGLATAELALERGYRTIILGRDDKYLAAAREKLIGIGGESMYDICACDLQDVGQLRGLLPKLNLPDTDLMGLVYCASVEVLKPVLEFNAEDLDTTWTVNILAPILLIQSCYPHLRRAGGSIVYIGSTADSRADATYSVYGGSKAFMRRFVSHAAQEFGFDGVRINVVSPGATDTPLLREFIARGQWSPEHLEKFLGTIPIEQRFAVSEEIAEAVWFALTGPKYLHGEDIRIDGGQR